MVTITAGPSDACLCNCSYYSAPMVFCVGYNYPGQGLCSLHPGTRRRIEYLAMCLQVLCWMVVMPGMWEVGTSFYNSGGTPLTWDEYVEDVWDICSFVLFCGGNSVYVVVSITLVLARLLKKKNTPTEWIPRKKVEYCGKIISPQFNGLDLFHYLVHMLALAINIGAAFCGADRYLSISMIIITFIQSILSYLYSTDIAICFCFCFCVNIFLVRRLPSSEQDLERSWMYEEWRLGTERIELVPEPWMGEEKCHEETRQHNFGSYTDYLFLTNGSVHSSLDQRGLENQNFEATEY